MSKATKKREGSTVTTTVEVALEGSPSSHSSITPSRTRCSGSELRTRNSTPSSAFEVNFGSGGDGVGAGRELFAEAGGSGCRSLRGRAGVEAALDAGLALLAEGGAAGVSLGLRGGEGAGALLAWSAATG